jgi:copper transport protein
LPNARGRAWLWAAVVALGLLVASGPVTAAAHAVLLRGTPSNRQSLTRAPDQVQLLFSESLDRVFSSVGVIDASGQRVDLGDGRVDAADDHLLTVSLKPGLPDGVYTVLWRSLSSIDVHPDEGQYPLFVGVPVAQQAGSSGAGAITATPETTFGRWWFYLGASLFGGTLATWKFVIGRLVEGPDAEAREALRRRVYRLIVLGGVLLIVGTLFTAVAQAAAAANVSLVSALGQPVADLLLRGRFASIWWPRMGLEVASVLLIVIGGVEGLASECALATLPAVLLTSALTSHGAAIPLGAAPGIAIDWLHILGATAWVGGLIGLVVLAPALWGAARSGPDPLLRTVIVGFGPFALAAALTVVLSGTLQSVLELGSWVALLSTTYGQLVLVKVGLLVAMLLLAVFNAWRVRNASPMTLGLVGGVRAELALGLVVLAVAALLSGTPPSVAGG